MMDKVIKAYEVWTADKILAKSDPEMRVAVGLGKTFVGTEPVWIDIMDCRGIRVIKYDKGYPIKEADGSDKWAKRLNEISHKVIIEKLLGSK